jgi:hypothetical protein
MIKIDLIEVLMADRGPLGSLVGGRNTPQKIFW